MTLQSDEEGRGGPSLHDCCHELHYRVAEFQSAYEKIARKYPERFPLSGIIQAQLNRLFSEYLKTGKITSSPVEGL